MSPPCQTRQPTKPARPESMHVSSHGQPSKSSSHSSIVYKAAEAANYAKAKKEPDSFFYSSKQSASTSHITPSKADHQFLRMMVRRAREMIFLDQVEGLNFAIDLCLEGSIELKEVGELLSLREKFEEEDLLIKQANAKHRHAELQCFKSTDTHLKFKLLQVGFELLIAEFKFCLAWQLKYKKQPFGRFDCNFEWSTMDRELQLIEAYEIYMIVISTIGIGTQQIAKSKQCNNQRAKSSITSRPSTIPGKIQSLVYKREPSNQVSETKTSNPTIKNTSGGKFEISSNNIRYKSSLFGRKAIAYWKVSAGRSKSWKICCNIRASTVDSHQWRRVGIDHLAKTRTNSNICYCLPWLLMISTNGQSKRMPYARRERQYLSPKGRSLGTKRVLEEESQDSMIEEHHGIRDPIAAPEHSHELPVRRFFRCTLDGGVSEHAVLRPILSPGVKLRCYTISYFLRHDIYTDIYFATDARFSNRHFEVYVFLKEIEGERKGSRTYLRRKTKASKKSEDFHDYFKFEGFQLVVKQISNTPKEFRVRSYDADFPLLPRLGDRPRKCSRQIYHGPTYADVCRGLRVKETLNKTKRGSDEHSRREQEKQQKRASKQRERRRAKREQNRSLLLL